jgi:two-component system, NarL family, nitrate/nitrite response regulator NarL
VQKHAVLIIGEIRLFREGLVQLLSADGRLEVSACADSVTEGVLMVQGCSTYPVVLLDMATRGSMEAIRALHNVHPDVKVVALGVAELEADIVACAEAGIDGYVPRGASLGDLVHSVECAIHGEVFCSPKAVGQLFRRLANLAPATASEEARDSVLTRREQQVLELISNGLSNKQIARTLGIELSTVKNHVHRVLEKLNVNRRAQIAARHTPIAPAVLPPTRTATRGSKVSA